MFGMIWYRSKVLNILNEKYNYKPAVPGMQSQVFNAVTKQIKKQGGNEYDGAIGFMLVQIESLQTENNQEVTEWKNKMAQISNSIMPLGKIGSELMK